MLLLAQQGAALGSDWKLSPKLSLEERYSDNIDLSREGRAHSDWVTSITPGIVVQRDGRRLKVNADYSLLGLIYANDSDRSRARHNLNGRANAEMLDDWLYLDATAHVSQELLSYSNGGGLGDAAGIGNTTQVASYSLSPYLKHRFGSAATVEARVAQEGVSGGGSALSDSSATGYKLNANSGTDFFPFSWGVSYDKRETDNQGIADTDSERASANARLQLRPGLGLMAQAGMEKGNFPGASNRVRDFSYYGLGAFYNSGRRFSMDLVYNLSDSGNFVSGSVKFNPTLRTTIDASSTVRNFGRSYSLGLNHRTRKSTWVVNYSESLTSFNESYIDNLFDAWRCGDDLIFPLPLDTPVPGGCSKLSDTSLAELSNLFRLFGLNAFNTSIVQETYVSKNLIGTLSYELRRTTLRVSVFDNRREYQASGNSDETIGMQASLSLIPGARDTYTLSGGVSRVEDTVSNREDDLWNVSLMATRTFQPKVTGSLELRHQQRESNQPNGDYAENSVAARLNMSF